MARTPANLGWLGFTEEQAGHLDVLDHLGKSGWDRTSQTNGIMPSLLADLWESGLTMDQVQPAMSSIGYNRQALHQLERWESKRAMGKFGR